MFVDLTSFFNINKFGLYIYIEFGTHFACILCMCVCKVKNIVTISQNILQIYTVCTYIYNKKMELLSSENILQCIIYKKIITMDIYVCN